MSNIQKLILLCDQSSVKRDPVNVFPQDLGRSVSLGGIRKALETSGCFGFLPLLANKKNPALPIVVAFALIIES